MNTYKLIKDNRIYSYYQAETIYHALTNAKWIYPWAKLSNIKLLKYK